MSCRLINSNGSYFRLYIMLQHNQLFGMRIYFTAYLVDYSVRALDHMHGPMHSWRLCCLMTQLS